MEDAVRYASQTVAPASATRGAHAAPHVTMRVLIATIVTLLVLTALTVAAAEIDLGSGNLWVALLIATAKATLVMLYFMHLRYDKPFNGVVMIIALAFLTLFIGLTLTDTLHYRRDVQTLRDEKPESYAPDLERF
jgi:cytochrome c oxidase subunit 4